MHIYLDMLGVLSYFAGAMLLAVYLTSVGVLGKGSHIWQTFAIIFWPIFILYSCIAGVWDAARGTK